MREPHCDVGMLPLTSKDSFKSDEFKPGVKLKSRFFEWIKYVTIRTCILLSRFSKSVIMCSAMLNNFHIISYLFSCRAIFANESSRNLFFFLLLNLSFAFVELAYGIWTNRWLETHFLIIITRFDNILLVQLSVSFDRLVNNGCLYFLSVLVWSPIHFTCSLIVRRS